MLIELSSATKLVQHVLKFTLSSPCGMAGRSSSSKRIAAIASTPVDYSAFVKDEGNLTSVKEKVIDFASEKTTMDGFPRVGDLFMLVKSLKQDELGRWSCDDIPSDDLRSILEQIHSADGVRTIPVLL